MAQVKLSGRLGHREGEVKQQKSRGWKAVGTRLWMSERQLQVGCSEEGKGLSGPTPSQLAFIRVVKTMSFGLRQAWLESQLPQPE